MLVLEILTLVTGITSVSLPYVAKGIVYLAGKLISEDPKINENLQKMGRALLKILSHVDDAENKLSMSNAYQTIIEDFKNVLFDAEDLLDEIVLGYERLNLQHVNLDESKKKDIKAFETDLGPKIDKMLQKVLDLASEMEGYMMISELSQPRPSQIMVVPQMSGSLVDESSVIGRKNDTQEMIKLVFDQSKIAKQSKIAGVSVIPIVGMVGIGKTTLAQLVFNDQNVVKEFERTRMWWVSVSFDDDVLKITKSICESTSKTVPDPSITQLSSLDSIQIKLQEIVGNQNTFLLVLDGMCDENPISWDALKLPFGSAAAGSIIIVTTRSHIVSTIITDSSAYCLDVLSDEHCWAIIKKGLRSSLSGDARLEKSGLQIAKKCKGLPLVAKLVGSVLRLKSKEMEWDEILKCELWNLAKDSKQIYPVLKLDYDHLPAYLKRCFAYCSLFPHGRPFQRDSLIQLWAAEGFIQSRGTRRIEDIGREYFDELCLRSFFKVSSNNPGEGNYEMHGFIHDLARLVSTNLCFTFEDGMPHDVIISRDVRHLSIICDENFKSDMLKELYMYEKLRTFMLLSDYSHNLEHVPFDFFRRFTCLRVLNLSGSRISELSGDIGMLIHLRDLNVSGTSIIKLPRSIDKLYGLERLNVNMCCRLEELPENLNKLVKLRHINCDRLHNLTSMPVDVGKLTSLETLPAFLVGSEQGKKIEELKDMRCLRGSICIKRLENVANSNEAKAAKLQEKQYLDELDLQWQSGRTETVDNEVLEGLQPHRSLKKLQLNGYCGSKFPMWMSYPSFGKLVRMDIKNCTSCTLLPSLGGLPLLKDLVIKHMKILKLVDYRFCESAGFPSLEKLQFGDMPVLRSWEGIEKKYMPCLKVLTIETCPELLTLPSLNYLASLEELEINRCAKLQSFPVEGLPSSLKSLIILESNKLKEKYCRVREGEHWEKIRWIHRIETDDGLIQPEGL